MYMWSATVNYSNILMPSRMPISRFLTLNWTMNYSNILMARGATDRYPTLFKTVNYSNMWRTLAIGNDETEHSDADTAVNPVPTAALRSIKRSTRRRRRHYFGGRFCSMNSILFYQLPLMLQGKEGRGEGGVSHSLFSPLDTLTVWTI